MLNLPAPNEPTDYLTQGMLAVQSSSTEVMSLEVANSLSVAVLDDLSMGAIAQVKSIIFIHFYNFLYTYIYLLLILMTGWSTLYR
jgi:hypothetical protein